MKRKRGQLIQRARREGEDPGRAGERERRGAGEKREEEGTVTAGDRATKEARLS